MEEITQVIDAVAQGNQPNELVHNIILNKVQDALDVKKAEIASNVYNQSDKNTDKN